MTCETCKAWEDMAPMGAFDGVCMGWCRKHNKAMDSDEDACEHYEKGEE